MTIPLRLGYKASAEQFGPNELADFAVDAENAGFDSVFVSDHLQPWMHEGGHAPAAIPWLGAVGARTSRVLLGIPWPEPPERFRRLKESLALLEKLWTGERVSYEGEFWQVRDATIYDRPDTPVPVYIGAAGPAATRLAGRVADGFITTSGKDPALYTDTLLPALDEGLEKSGRTREDIDTLIEVKVSYHPDPDEALERTRFWAPLALSPDEKVGIHDPIEMQRRAAELPIERVAKRFIVSSDPDEHVERIVEVAQRGFRHLVFHDPGHDQAEFIERYRRDILPRLRERLGT